jgi:hypothetical protein
MKKRLSATLLASLMLAANVLGPLCGGVATRAMASDTVSGGDIQYQESVSQNDFFISDDSVSQGDVLPDEGGGSVEGPESAGQDDTDNYAHNYIDEHAVRVQNTEADSMVMPDKSSLSRSQHSTLISSELLSLRSFPILLASLSVIMAVPPTGL